jgi:cellulose synthase/poly-beta-1,6-N-acetylglucosamine synthase-like glycosyltransferase
MIKIQEKRFFHFTYLSIINKNINYFFIDVLCGCVFHRKIVLKNVINSNFLDKIYLLSLLIYFVLSVVYENNRNKKR